MYKLMNKKKDLVHMTKDNLHFYHSSTTSGLRSVRHKTAVLWNGLTSALQQIESLPVFKRKSSQVSLTVKYMSVFMYIVILLQGIYSLSSKMCFIVCAYSFPLILVCLYF